MRILLLCIYCLLLFGLVLDSVVVTEDELKSEESGNDQQRGMTLKRAHRLHYLLGMEAFQQQNYLVAHDYLSRAIELDPTDAYSLLWRGTIAALARQWEPAIADATAASELNAADPVPWILLARIALATHRPSDAVPAVSRARTAAPNSPTVIALWNKLFTGAAAHGASAAALALSGAPEAALAELDLATSLDPTPGLMMKKSRILRSSGDFKQSILSAEAAKTASRPGSKAEQDAVRLIALGHNDLGLAALANQEHATALNHLDIAVKMDPDELVFLRNRGDLHRAMGSLDLALADYHRTAEAERAAAAVPGQNEVESAARTASSATLVRIAATHAARGAMASQAGDAGAASVEFSSAITASPGEPKYYFARAAAHSALSRWTAALDDTLAGLKRAPRAMAGLKLLKALVPDHDRLEQLANSGRLDPVSAGMLLGGSSTNSTASSSFQQSAGKSPSKPRPKVGTRRSSSAKSSPALRGPDFRARMAANREVKDLLEARVELRLPRQSWHRDEANATKSRP